MELCLLGGLGRFGDFRGEVRRHLLVAAELHFEGALAAGDRAQLGAKLEGFRLRHIGRDRLQPILRPHADLQEELHKTFKGEKDVKVIVDRRYGERRTSRKPVVKERRRSDQRRTKEQLVEVVISA